MRVIVFWLVLMSLASLCSADVCQDRVKEIDLTGKVQLKDIQKTMDALSACGGGVLRFGPGVLEVPEPLLLRPDVSLQGIPELSVLELSAKGAITQNPNEKLSGISFSGFKIVRGQKRKKGLSVMTLFGHDRCKIEDLVFHGFKNSSIFTIAPHVVTRPPMNAVFNVYRDWYANACTDCIVYKGNKGAVISSNSWYDIKLRKVYERGIAGYQWADSEKWYNFYAQAWSPDTILVDLNVDRKEWLQIDRFHFYSPTLVYAPVLKKDRKNLPTAIRFGAGTFRHFFIGLISDKVWNDFIIDEGARSYYILKGSSGKGFYENIGVISKGFDGAPQPPAELQK